MDSLKKSSGLLVAYMNPDNLLFEEKPMPKTLLYILPRCPPVANWVGIFIFFKVSFMKHPSEHESLVCQHLK